MSVLPSTRTIAVRIALATTIVIFQSGQAADYALGDGKMSVGGSVFLGTAIRTDSQDSKLLSNLNSSLLSIPGNSVSPSAGRNQDDGNLNFNRGDPVATVLKAYLTLGYQWHNYGVAASGQAWYDYATADSGHPWGNVPNDYVPGRPLGEHGALPRSKFSGIVADDFYGYGHHQREALALDWRVGYQTLDWGNRMLVMGGLRDLNPLNVPGSLRPGALRGQETRVAFPAVFARLGLPSTTSLEAFYQLYFEPTAPNECGTFFSQLDFYSEGCNKAMVGNISDRTAVATGIYVKRSETHYPSDSGQGGLALKHTVEAWATEFGLYAAQYDSRTAFYSGTKSLRIGPPFLPRDPGNLNPTYFTEYPTGIHMFGATFDTKFKGGAVFGEFTYRPNQPLQYNSVDVLAAAVSLTAPTPLRPIVQALAPGAAFHAWERHEVMQLQLGISGQLPDVLGAAGMSFGGELVYKRVPDLPDPQVVRFGRSEVFGQGPVNGVCPPPAAPVACSLDGYVSRDAFGYRLRAGLRYSNVVDGVDLLPSVAFGQDLSGWSADGWILQGRMLANVSVQANFASHWTATIAWQPTGGGTYNNLRDRSTAQAFAGYQF